MARKSPTTHRRRLRSGKTITVRGAGGPRKIGRFNRRNVKGRAIGAFNRNRVKGRKVGTFNKRHVAKPMSMNRKRAIVRRRRAKR